MTTTICEEESIDPTECGCSLADSPCINVTGKGTVANPLSMEFRIDTDADNLVSCGAAGLLATMADRFTWPTMRKVRETKIPIAKFDPISFTTIEYDDYAMSTFDHEARIPFDAKWRISAYANFDNNDASYNSLRLELNKGSGFSMVTGVRENRDLTSTHETFITLADEFYMEGGDRVRIAVNADIGEDEAIWILRASLVVTLVSL